ncbi:uncharacterized protein [Typha latifolia]|uniref:uncharacterized protein n=1 Tax=Typha latifolia TaxID=4733 RepID=UPI003C2C33BA
MGKVDEEQQAGSGTPESADIAGGNADGGRCSRCGRIVRLRCVAALILGAAVLLSAVFWLPPFVGRRRDADPGHVHGADIVASFRLQRSLFELKKNMSQLEYDIFEEIGVPNSSVVISSLEPISGSNWTNVVFGIWPYPRNLTISPTGLSILRSYFMSLVVGQSTLHLTTSLFGNSSIFEVLKFPGGITIIPQQNAFLLQKPHAVFNFSLNFPIDEVKDKVDELKEQMKLGLLLNDYENLYVKLTNLEGSTTVPPTIVQTSIILAVRNNQPRLKQLAQTITNSSSGNLGLNHTVFGRVKQIHLSSYLQRSLSSGGSASSPSPAPQPHVGHHHYHHHRHHHHNHGGDKHFPPAPSSSPRHSYQTPAPSGCRFRHSGKPKNNAHLVPSVAPDVDQHHFAPPLASPLHSVAPAGISFAPTAHEDPPAPAPRLPVSPLPSVVFTHERPPSGSIPSNKPSGGMLSISPTPFTSSASAQTSFSWAITTLLYLLTTSLL